MEKAIQQKQKVGIVTSLNDKTLTKVTYGNYATRVPDEVAYGIYEWFSSQQNTLLHMIKQWYMLSKSILIGIGTREKRNAHACLPCFRRIFAIEIIRDNKTN